MWTQVRRDPIDLAFLNTRSIDVERVEISFFQHPHSWTCPVCATPKHQLIHRRRNGQWFSGIEQHHHGSVQPTDLHRYMTENRQTSVCYHCNDVEKWIRKKSGCTPMSIAAMRSSTDFLAKRALRVTRDTYGTPDPKGKWNVDGTRRTNR